MVFAAWRRLCSTAPAAAPVRLTRATRAHTPVRADECELWVSYVDPPMLRRQLAGLARQLQEFLPEPHTRIVLPRGDKCRHGYWFMEFAEVAHRNADNPIRRWAAQGLSQRALGGATHQTHQRRPPQ